MMFLRSTVTWVQLCQMGNDNPDIVILKVDFDENRDVVKPLAIKVRNTSWCRKAA